MNEILWKPTLSEIEDSQAWEFIQEANIKFNISLENFYDLYTWSCKCPESFWELFWEYSKIIAEKDSKKVLKNGDDFFKVRMVLRFKIKFCKQSSI